jgi:hypothetical protein
VVNALALMGTSQAQVLLAHFVKSTDVSKWRHEVTIALSTMREPHSTLVATMAGRLDKFGEKDGALLLASTAAAAKVRGQGSKALSGAVAYIDDVVKARLELVEQTERDVWAPFHNKSRNASDEAWERLHDEAMHQWISHHSQLDGKAYEWEVAHAKSHGEHVAHAREMWHLMRLARDPNYSSDSEEAHHNQVVLALRAAHNARSDAHVALVGGWLEHSKEELAAEAASALGAHEGLLAEELSFPSFVQSSTARCMSGDRP